MAKKYVKKDGRPFSCTINVKPVRSRKNPKILILRASGKFCSHESSVCGIIFLKNLKETLDNDRKNLILNLAGITVLDAVGIGVLATFIGWCFGLNIKLVWCTAKSRVRDKLLMSKLIYAVPYYETEEEALNSFNK